VTDRARSATDSMYDKERINRRLLTAKPGVCVTHGVPTLAAHQAQSSPEWDSKVSSSVPPVTTSPDGTYQFVAIEVLFKLEKKEISALPPPKSKFYIGFLVQ
jgi:hypothetical protein